MSSLALYKQRDTITNVLDRIDPDKFRRIHRSTIVNVNEIHSLHHLYKGEYEIWLTTGDRVVSSRMYNHVIQALLGKKP